MYYFPNMEHQAFLSLSVQQHAQEDDFETFALFIRKPHILQTTTRFLKSLNENLKITAREMLSTYLFSYFPDDTLSTQMNNREKQIYDISQEIIDLVQIEPLQRTDLSDKLDAFRVCFTIWKQEDKASLLQSLSKIHTHLKTLPTDNVSQEDKQKVDKKIQQIKGFAHNIDGDQGVSHVETASQYGLTDPTVLAGQIHTEMKKAFWDLFQEDMAQQPPDLHRFPDLVKDIREALERILPQKNIKTTTLYIRQHLDEKDVSKGLQQGTFHLQDVYRLSTFVYEMIKELGAAIDDSAVDDRVSWLDQEIVKVQANPKESFAVFMRELFSDIMNRLDHIESCKL
jgi:ribosomal protein S15P/S13E